MAAGKGQLVERLGAGTDEIVPVRSFMGDDNGMPGGIIHLEADDRILAGV